MIKVLTKKIYLIFLSASFITASLFMIFISTANKSFFAYAESSEPAYHYFDSPKAIAADSDYLYVADMNSIVFYSFSSGNVEHEKTITSSQGTVINKLSSFGASLYAVENTKDNNGELAVYNKSSQIRESLSPISFDYNDITANSTGIFAAKLENAGQNRIHQFTPPQTADGTYPINTFYLGQAISKIISVGNDIYMAGAQKTNENITDIYRFTPTGFPLANDFADSIVRMTDAIDGFLDMAYIPSQGMLALIVQNALGGRLELYSITDSDLTFYKSAALTYTPRKICVNENSIFILNSDKSVSRHDLELNSFDVILASSSNIESFYNSPSDAVAKKGAVYVADRLNNRISIESNVGSSIIDYDFVRPLSVAVNINGDIFAAHSSSKITGFNSLHTPIYDATLASPISIIRTDSDNSLFALLQNNTLYKKTASQTEFNQMSYHENDKRIYGFDSALNSPFSFFAINKVENETSTKEIIRLNADGSYFDTGISVNDFISLAADSDGSFYVLKDGNIVEYYSYQGSSYSKIISHLVTSSKQLVRLSVSGISTSVTCGGKSISLRYRDLIAVDSGAHTLQIIPRETFSISAALPEDDNTPPVVSDALPHEYNPQNTVGIIRTIVLSGGSNIYANATDIHPLLASGSPILLPNEHRVIVLEWSELSDFALVLSDNIGYGSSPIVGYIYKQSLSAPLPYTDSHEKYCTVWLEQTAIHKYPSIYAPVINGFSEVKKNTPFEILDFCYEVDEDAKKIYGYIDNLTPSNKWYRVKLTSDGKFYEGYVRADSVSIHSANPSTDVRPKTNAEIIALDKNFPSIGATVYYLREGGDEKNDEDYLVNSNYPPIPVGTKIEIVGVFDSSKTFTKIIYQSEFGILECYVKTANIQYDGFNIVQVIAIALIFITIIVVLLAAVIFTKRKKTKHIIIAE